MNNKQANTKNFTLIEILVVISIIAILAGFLFPAIAVMPGKAGEKSTKNTIHVLMGALESYKNDWGSYPPSWTNGNKNTTEPLQSGTAPWTTSAVPNGTAAMLEALLTHKKNGPYFSTVDEQNYAPNLSHPSVGTGCLIDAWGYPLAYRQFRHYNKTGSGYADLETAINGKSPLPTKFSPWDSMETPTPQKIRLRIGKSN